MTDSTQRFSGELVPKQQQGGGDGSLQIGSVLQNRYRITAVLGVGGMGSVYLARDQRFTNVIRNVAVKEMLNMQQDPGMREMTLKNFIREADVLASLTHPSIPQIYDVFVSKDRAYLVMEFIDGKDLEAYVSQTADFIPHDTVCKWAVDLCDVLQYLHTRDPMIVFRDMKPSNVMIDKAGRIRLIDFGIAKPFQPANQVKGTLIGTDGYAPPEQYRGVASPSGDLYALGATLHHILTKRDPRLEQPFTFNQRPIRSINPRVPVDLEAVVMRALSDDAAARYPSALARPMSGHALPRRLRRVPG
jgi:serine/threonine protein kinase